MTPKGLLIGLFFGLFTYSLYILLPIDLIKKWGSMSFVTGIGMTTGAVFCYFLSVGSIFSINGRFCLIFSLYALGIIVIGDDLCHHPSS